MFSRNLAKNSSSILTPRPGAPCPASRASPYRKERGVRASVLLAAEAGRQAVRSDSSGARAARADQSVDSSYGQSLWSVWSRYSTSRSCRSVTFAWSCWTSASSAWTSRVSAWSCSSAFFASTGVRVTISLAGTSAPARGESASAPAEVSSSATGIRRLIEGSISSSPCAGDIARCGEETRRARRLFRALDGQRSARSSHRVAGVREEERTGAARGGGAEPHPRKQTRRRQSTLDQQRSADLVDHPDLERPRESGECDVEELSGDPVIDGAPRTDRVFLHQDEPTDACAAVARHPRRLRELAGVGGEDPRSIGSERGRIEARDLVRVPGFPPPYRRWLTGRRKRSGNSGELVRIPIGHEAELPVERDACGRRDEADGRAAPSLRPLDGRTRHGASQPL